MPIKAKVHVIIHQNKRKHNGPGFPNQSREHIHPIDFSVSVREHHISAVTVSVTMIAVYDRIEEII